MTRKESVQHIDVDDLEAGDRITWQWSPLGDEEPPEHTARIKRIIKWGTTPNYQDAPYVDFYATEGMQRSVALPFITHHNGRRVDRRYWAEKLPGLKLHLQVSSNGSRASGVQQLRLPMNEEDALALKTSTRKGLDEMSESHRKHIEKWEPHVEAMGAEHVWASANRFSARGGTGLVYAAIKRGSKDYAIVEYNTETQKKAKVLDDGFESSKTVMEAFKEYRGLAKEQRTEDREARKASAKKTTPKASAKKPAAKKPAAKRKPAARKK